MTEHYSHVAVDEKFAAVEQIVRVVKPAPQDLHHASGERGRRTPNGDSR